MKCINCDNRISTLRDICPFCIEDLREYKRANGHKILHPEKSYAELVAMIEEQPRPPGFEEYMRDSGVYRQERLSSCVISREELLGEIDFSEVKVKEPRKEREASGHGSVLKAETDDHGVHASQVANPFTPKPEEVQPILEQDTASKPDEVVDFRYVTLERSLSLKILLRRRPVLAGSLFRRLRRMIGI